MPKLVSEPLITYTCRACGAVSSADPHEFTQLNTMLPTYRSTCAFCGLAVICSPPAMIARTVAQLSNVERMNYIESRLRR